MAAALGHGRKEPVPSELNTAQVARKSLVAARDILAGETLTGLSRRVPLVLALVALAVARLAPERTIFWYVIFGRS